MRNTNSDAIILDIIMPKLDGYELVKRLRPESISTTLLVLTAKKLVQDLVHGLDLGTDDYIIKPFSFNVLLARLRAVRRRARIPLPLQLQVVISCSTCHPGSFPQRDEDFAHAD